MASFPPSDPGSFRDPAGRVAIGDAVYRVLFQEGRDWLSSVWESGIVGRLAGAGRLVATRPSGRALESFDGREVVAVLEHDRLPFISYPYEWPFAALKAAALAHLDLHLALLDEGFTLSDATAFNMQFVATAPLHIDVLSIVPYRDGDRFAGYAQFQRQFLNPLVIEAETAVSCASCYRGSLDGVASDDCWRLLPLRTRLRPAYWMHIGATAGYDRRLARAAAKPAGSPDPLPKRRLVGLLQHLRMTIEGLRPSPAKPSVWLDYANDCSYEAADTAAKLALVAAFCERYGPGLILDVGCNTGLMAEQALRCGAGYAVGVEADRATADAAFLRARNARLAFLPLNVDLVNPSPAQGWRYAERQSFRARLRADALLALAVIHHICIARNVPITDAVATLVDLAPCGLIEFVPKEDAQAQRLLRHRQDIFGDYTLENFRALLASRARIVEESAVTATGRRIFSYERG